MRSRYIPNGNKSESSLIVISKKLEQGNLFGLKLWMVVDVLIYYGRGIAIFRRSADLTETIPNHSPINR